jgi:hypothetical protein
MFAETRPAAYGEIGAGLAQVEQPFTAAELSWGLSRAGKLTENIERALKQGSQALGRLLRSRGYERVEHKPYRDEIDADGRPTGKKRRAEFGLWYQPSEMDAEEAKRRWEARQHAPSPGEEGKAGLKVIKG